MFKRYLGYALIATSLAVVGCSSSDDDADPTDGGAPTEPVDPVDPVDPADPVDPVDPVGFTPPAGAAASVLDLVPVELTNALGAAGITELPAGNFTIFSPSSEVLTAAQADGTMLDAAALQLHVVEGVIAADPGATGATALADGDVATLGGGSATIAGTTFGGANITAADMFATNGVVHFIDGIAVPAVVAVDPPPVGGGDTGDASCGDPNAASSAPVAGSTYALIAADPELSSFRALLEDASLGLFCSNLNDPTNNWTVFAPNNAAVDGFTGGAIDLTNHIHTGGQLATIADLVAADALTDATGNVMLPGLLSAASNRLEIDGGASTVNGQPILGSFASTSGAYHIIGGILAQ